MFKQYYKNGIIKQYDDDMKIISKERNIIIDGKKFLIWKSYVITNKNIDSINEKFKRNIDNIKSEYGIPKRISEHYEYRYENFKGSIEIAKSKYGIPRRITQDYEYRYENFNMIFKRKQILYKYDNINVLIDSSSKGILNKKAGYEIYEI